MEATVSPAAFVISASSKTMAGDFPPSSSTTFLRLLEAAACWILRPVKVEPVKFTRRMSVWEDSVEPEGVPGGLSAMGCYFFRRLLLRVKVHTMAAEDVEDARREVGFMCKGCELGRLIQVLVRSQST